jgi:protein SCO1/2
VLWVAVALALAAYAFVQLRPPAATEASPAGPPLAPFTLINGKGQPFSSAKLEGKPLALYFGFTRCGDACPTTLGRMARLRDRIGGPDKFNLVFITIDPEHDGPAKVGQYATLFDTPIIGLTGSSQAIAKVKKDYGIHAEPTPHAGAGMEMAHTTAVLLFDRDGRRAGNISPNDSDETALAALKRIIA